MELRLALVASFSPSAQRQVSPAVPPPFPLPLASIKAEVSPLPPQKVQACRNKSCLSTRGLHPFATPWWCLVSQRLPRAENRPTRPHDSAHNAALIHICRLCCYIRLSLCAYSPVVSPYPLPSCARAQRCRQQTSLSIGSLSAGSASTAWTRLRQRMGAHEFGKESRNMEKHMLQPASLF